MRFQRLRDLLPSHSVGISVLQGDERRRAWPTAVLEKRNNNLSDTSLCLDPYSERSERILTKLLRQVCN